MKSARSIADQKLQKQIEEAEKKRAELLKSMEQGDAELGQLRKSLATARMSGRASGRVSERPAADEAPPPKGRDAAKERVRQNVQRVLVSIDDFLRLRNFRLIDLFRSASINLSLESEGDADGYRLQPEDSLSADEVYALLHSARIRISRADVYEVVNELDQNGNLEIEINEFEKAIREAHRAAAKKDHMHYIASAIKKDRSHSRILLLTTRTATREAKAIVQPAAP